MKKYFMSFALLFALVFALNGVAFGWGTTGGDGSDYRQLQETAVFYNSAGHKLVHGQAVILDTTDGTAGSTLGAYVTDVTGTADSVLVVGVVKEASENGTPVIVVTKGPIDALADDAADAVSAGSAVGTSGSTAYGSIGGGTNLGIALENGAGTNGDYLMIWVDPTGAD